MTSYENNFVVLRSMDIVENYTFIMVVQVTSRLIEENNVRILEERASQEKSLFFSPRKFGPERAYISVETLRKTFYLLKNVDIFRYFFNIGLSGFWIAVKQVVVYGFVEKMTILRANSQIL